MDPLTDCIPPRDARSSSGAVNVFAVDMRLPLRLRELELFWVPVTSIPEDLIKKTSLAYLLAEVVKRCRCCEDVAVTVGGTELMLKQQFGHILTDQQGERDILGMARSYGRCPLCTGQGTLLGEHVQDLRGMCARKTVAL